MEGQTTIELSMQTPAEYDKKYWHNRVMQLLEKVEGGKHVLFRKLATIDPFYLSAEGSTAVRHVLMGRAGLGVTKRLHDTLVKYVERQNISER